MRLDSSQQRTPQRVTLPSRTIDRRYAPPRADSIRRAHRNVFGEAIPVRLISVAYAHAFVLHTADRDRRLALAMAAREREDRELRWQREAYLLRTWR